MSHSGGRATQFDAANTGAPGDNALTCGTCHNGGSFGTSIEISLIDSDGNTVSDYIAGQTYTVTATINTTSNPNGYGLQMVGLIDNGNTNAGTLANQSINAQLADLNSRTYLEQAGLSAQNQFSAEWTAPNTGSGSVTFYAAGHAANGNGQSGGDDSAQTSTSFSENIVESTIEFNTVSIEINPNPIRDITNIKFDEIVEGQMSIYNSTGQVMLSNSVFAETVSIDMTEYSTGVYYLTIETDKGITTRQLIKL